MKHYPIEDIKAPSLDGIIECINWIESNLKNNKKVLVHCKAGLILRTYLIASSAVSPYFLTKKHATIVPVLP